ncbi:MAG: class I SAM-dependent methyltransferase [Clostridia bacterium]|nr:class I SAM-dependent methyltransferase [Clostridia bacterium]
MPIIQGQEWTFDTRWDAYDKIRPGYPEELYREIFHYVNLHEGSRAAEVGIGAGQATEPILKTGASVLAFEPGRNFTKLCLQKFSAYPFDVVNMKFDDAPYREKAFDLVYSAAAFHWVNQDTGYQKVFRMLKKGGAFARFANHPYRDEGNMPLWQAVQAAYDEFYYPFYGKKSETPEKYTEENAKTRAELALKYGFTDIKYALFERTRTFSAEEYILLISTYSDHIAIDEEIRKRFFDRIEEAINAHGGCITLCDTLDLALARKA